MSDKRPPQTVEIDLLARDETCPLPHWRTAINDTELSKAVLSSTARPPWLTGNSTVRLVGEPRRTTCHVMVRAARIRDAKMLGNAGAVFLE